MAKEVSSEALTAARFWGDYLRGFSMTKLPKTTPSSKSRRLADLERANVVMYQEALESLTTVSIAVFERHLAASIDTEIMRRGVSRVSRGTAYALNQQLSAALKKANIPDYMGRNQPIFPPRMQTIARKGSVITTDEISQVASAVLVDE